MKEQIHQQISSELKQAARMDLVTAVVTVGVTLTLFFIAMGFAYSSVGTIIGELGGGLGGLMGNQAVTFNTTNTIIMFVVIIVIGVINWYAVRGLLKNKAQRSKMAEGFLKLYQDEGVGQYYDTSLFKSFETRYNTFAITVGAIGALGIIVPLAIFINKLTEL